MLYHCPTARSCIPGGELIHWSLTSTVRSSPDASKLSTRESYLSCCSMSSLTPVGYLAVLVVSFEPPPHAYAKSKAANEITHNEKPAGWIVFIVMSLS